MASIRVETPYRDRFGNRICVGDVMVHPDGNEFTVGYDQNKEGASKWRAIYGGGVGTLQGVTVPENLWLGNQVGKKGQAVLRGSAEKQAKDRTLQATMHLLEHCMPEHGALIVVAPTDPEQKSVQYISNLTDESLIQMVKRLAGIVDKDNVYTHDQRTPLMLTDDEVTRLFVLVVEAHTGGHWRDMDQGLMDQLSKIIKDRQPKEDRDEPE